MTQQTGRIGRHRQRGNTTFAIFAYIVTGWVLITALLRVLPIYMEHQTIKSVLEDTVASYQPARDRTATVRENIERGFTVNRISHLAASDVKIQRERDSLTLSADYEVRFSLIGALQGVWHFDSLTVSSTSSSGD